MERNEYGLDVVRDTRSVHTDMHESGNNFELSCYMLKPFAIMYYNFEIINVKISNFFLLNFAKKVLLALISNVKNDFKRSVHVATTASSTVVLVIAGQSPFAQHSIVSITYVII